MYISIHALREEGDSDLEAEAHGEGISIHALREEGDYNGAVPDRRRRTISIHALREEGDPAAATNSL